MVPELEIESSGTCQVSKEGRTKKMKCPNKAFENCEYVPINNVTFSNIRYRHIDENIYGNEM